MQKPSEISGSPLSAIRVAVTRSEHQASGLEYKLRSIGANVAVYPTIGIELNQDPRAFSNLLATHGSFDWVLLTSVNAVRWLSQQTDCKAVAQSKIGAIGPATESALKDIGLHVDLVPSEFVTAAFIKAFADRLHGSMKGVKVFLPRGNMAKPDLPDALRSYGCTVVELIAYRNVPGSGVEPLVQAIAAGEVDVLTFASSSSVKNFINGAESLRKGAVGFDYTTFPKVFCIGPVTAATAKEAGLPVAAVAEHYDAEGLLRSILNSEQIHD